MKILFLSVTINWVYRLYEEYILSIINFIKKNYSDIIIEVQYINQNNFNMNNVDFSKYSKIIYYDNIEIFLKIINNKKEYNEIDFHNEIENEINEQDKNKIENIEFYDKYDIYFLNIEQLSKESYLLMLLNIPNNISIIDYSEENISLISNKYNTFLLPPYVKSFQFLPSIKNIDILSLTNNSYRDNFYNLIQISSKFSKKTMNNIYGFDRDDLYNRTKIYINIHCSEEHKTMEMIRIVNLIMRKVIVISQNSIHKDLLFLKDYIYVINDINEISNVCNNILENYIDYYNKIYKSFDDEKYYKYIKHHCDLFLFASNS